MPHVRPLPHVLQAIGFVSLGLCSIGFLLTQVTHHQTLPRRQITYRITAVFDDVGQLKTGAPVSISGVNIGQVSAIDLIAEPLKATVVMDISNQYDQISRDSDASINTQGVLGGQFVRITTGGLTTYLRDGDQLHSTHSAISIDAVLNGLLKSSKDK